MRPLDSAAAPCHPSRPCTIKRTCFRVANASPRRTWLTSAGLTVISVLFLCRVFLCFVCRAQVPADIILLQTSEPQGLCYIETSNIDGETNLKIKEAVPGVAQACPTPEAVAAFRGVATYEHPNGSIYTFAGSLLQSGRPADDAMPLGPQNMVLRGCTLRNTGWVLGLVVFSGVETKVGCRGGRLRR